jgi:hypothetical protein
MTLSPHDGIERRPLVTGAAGRGSIDMAKKTRDVLRAQAVERIVGTGQLSFPFHGYPVTS